MPSERTSPFGKIEGPLSAQDYQPLSLKAPSAHARATHRRFQLRPPTAKARLIAAVALRARRNVDYLRRTGEPFVTVDVIEQPIAGAHVRGECEELSDTFASACREADREHRQHRARQSSGDPHRSRLPKSTADAIDWLLAQRDEERIQKFLQGRTREDLTSIRNYILWKTTK